MDDKHLIATDGMVLTNGDIYVSQVWLGAGDSPNNWWEITKEEAATARQADLPFEE